ncbi:MAG TPA: phytoene/squalene synthase family protein [Anaerolineales bacterium]|nr:phytoene/squalene synthase family protein [Anaerolineales bacterium]
MTTYQPRAWENTLLSFAHEGWETRLRPLPVHLEDIRALDEAYAYCDFVTRVNSRSFYAASSFLPYEKRRSIRALYAVCRVCDNIVDKPVRDRLAKLANWSREALSRNPSPDALIAMAWADTRRRYHIPQRYTEQLFEGVARDLGQDRYQTFDDLATYAYGVASTVGLMSMHIIGFEGPAALPYAVKLGVALQITNILRDIGEDFRSGRVYLPLEELSAFDLSEQDLSRGLVDDRWRAFMRFQIGRNRQLYAEAWPGVGMLNTDGRMAIAAAAKIYGAILDDIEAHDYDVFQRRAHVSTWKKLSMLPGIWWGVHGLNIPDGG